MVKGWGALAQFKGGIALSSPSPVSHRMPPPVPSLLSSLRGGGAVRGQNSAQCFRIPGETEAFSAPMGCPRGVGPDQALYREGAPLLTALLDRSAPYSNSPHSASNCPDLPGRHHFLKLSPALGEVGSW